MKKDKLLEYKIAKIQSKIMAFTMSIIGGLTIFIATIWLVLRGGKNVGEHLGLLANFFPGFSVTWQGSIIGMFYGMITGAIIGWMIGFLYYRIVLFRN